MTLFEGLLAAHLLGDWLLQTEWQAQNKTHNWRALLTHIVIYHAVILAVIVFGYGFRNITAYVVVIVLAVTHAILDRRSFELWLMRTFRLTVERPPERWLVLAVDQSIHLLLLAGATLALTGFSAY